MNNSLMTSAEKNTALQWMQGALNHVPLFSFTYSSIPSTQLLRQWPAKRASTKNADGTVQHSVIYNDLATGLECELRLTEYPDSPAFEWLVFFRNTGTANTPILENIQALDLQRECPVGSNAVLHFSK